MKSSMRILFGAAAIMALSTLTGIIHNSVRSKSIPLVPQISTSPGAHPGGPGEDRLQTQDSRQPTDGPEDISDPTIVTAEETKSAMDDPNAFIIDARSEEEYTEGHIPGAVNVPHDRFADLYNYVIESIPMDAKVICYCRSETCDFSDHLAEELRIAGFENVLIFRDGWDAWVAAGHEVERE